MGRTALDKLRSRKGASLTFALLAFLVCAVISAVLLASASASAGRLSNLAESDQRYYAVTSAAQLFCDALKDQTFTIERVETTTNTTEREYIEVSGIVVSTAVGDSDTTRDYEMTLQVPGSGVEYETDDKTHTSDQTKSDIAGWRGESVFTDAALSYVIGTGDNVTAELAFAKLPGSAGSIKTAEETSDAGDLRIIKTWDLKLDFSATGGSGDSNPVIPIVATASLRNDGSMLIEFWNDDGDMNFKTTVTLTATVTDNSTLPEVTTNEDVYWSVVLREEIPYNHETTVTMTTSRKTTAISWRVTEIKKGAA